MGNGIKVVMGQIRALKMGLEEAIHAHVKGEHPIMSWLVPYAAMTLSRHPVGTDGRTAY